MLQQVYYGVLHMQQTSAAKIKSQKTQKRYSALQLRQLPALLMLFALALSSLYLMIS